MVSSWTGSVELLAGQVAVISTEVVGPSFIMRLTVPEVSFEADFVFTGSRFFFETPPNDYLTSVEAVDMMPVSDSRSLSVRFAGVAGGMISASLEIKAGDATLIGSSITAE